MDELWGNAWGESTASSDTEVVRRSWSSQPEEEQEADVGAPSWSTGAEIQWNEPSETPSSLWTPNGPTAWDSGDNMFLARLHRSRSRSLTPTPEARNSNPVALVESPFAEESERQHSPEPAAEVTPPSLSPQTSPPGTPDHFGTFESGSAAQIVFNHGEDEPHPWTPLAVTFESTEEDSEGWGSAWVPPAAIPVDVTQDHPKDEWDIANEHKRKRDRKIPPELLAAILSQCSEYANETWPEAPIVSSDTSVQDWRENLRVGLESVEGVTALVNHLLPEMTLPPPIHFRKTETAKAMSSALHLTKHVPLAQLSPMSHLLAAKGSSAWELSVKSRVEVARDDVPAGWRILEPEATVTETTKETKTGGFMSFWTRRTSVPAVQPDAKSEAPSSSPSTSTLRTASPVSSATSPNLTSSRPSMESVRSPSSIGIASPIAPSPSSLATSMLSIGPSSLPPVAPSTNPELEKSSASTPPSAVSRFLTRFSRTKAALVSSGRDGFALSSNDLEYLSDVVPSAGDDYDDEDGFRGLSSMIRSEPPIPTKLPPPLAPPPKPTSTSRSKHPESLMGRAATLPNSSHEFDEFFNALDPEYSTPKTNGHLLEEPFLLPKPLPPPVSMPASRASSIPRTGPTPPLNEDFLRRRGSPLALAPSPFTERAPISFGILPLQPSRTISPRLPPPPSSRSSTPAPPAPIPVPSPCTFPALQSDSSSALKAFDDDDEFSDFHSSTMHRLQSHNSLVTSSSSTGPLFVASSISSGSGAFSTMRDFDNFVSSPIRSPSPPSPPLKGPPHVVQQNGGASHPRTSSRASNHRLTIDLMEKAAARPGRWPAPPSPLPQALPPPPRSSFSSTTDLLSDGSPMKTKQATHAVMSTSSSVDFAMNGAVTPLLPPPISSQPTKLVVLPPPVPHSHRVAPVAQAVPSGPKGLSAQDLSFFEGL